jgi:sporulation protein YhbH
MIGADEGFTVSDGRGRTIKTLGDDQRRHRERIEEALRRNLADMVVQEQIVVAQGEKTYRVALDMLKEARIRFDDHHGGWIGMAQQEDKPGGSLAAESSSIDGSHSGGSQASEAQDEGPVLFDELASALFDQWSLPDLDPDRRAPGHAEEPQLLHMGQHGARRAKQATLKANLLRRAKEGAMGIGDLDPDDLRHWKWVEPPDSQGGAVVMALMDTSGSMGTFEKYLAKSFFYWATEFLRRSYPLVEVVFIAHDVRAREVDEETFFHRGASGGTVSSSAYRMAHQVLEDRYPADTYNAYAFHFSDGGNLTSDNPAAVEAGLRLSGRVNMFGYGEIHDTERAPSQLYQTFERARLPVVLMHRQEDVWSALHGFFGKAEARATSLR